MKRHSDRKSYYVGVLLSGSRNKQNRIQFFLKKNNDGTYSLYSRNSHFDCKPDLKKCRFIDKANTQESLLKRIMQAGCTMKVRGISVPGTQVFEVA